MRGSSGEGTSGEGGGGGGGAAQPHDGGGGVGGDEFGMGGSGGGIRWPRAETLALIRIRSEMDGAFRDSTPKGPLWEEVSRKMAQLGYQRNAKKCKEKFENVYKYHKRTKEGRVGKPEGKTYRFFDQLEALEHHHFPSLPPPPPPPPQAALPLSMAMPANPTTTTPPTIPSNSATEADPISVAPPPPILNPMPFQPTYTNTSSTPSSSSSTSSDEEILGRRKRKRKWKDFFERMMKEVIEKQEAMQRRLLEAIERKENERMMREETWKRLEMERLNREHEMLVKERSTAASKDAALISFLQRLSEQHRIPLPTHIEQAQPQEQVRGSTTMTATVVHTPPAHPPQPPPPPQQPQVQGNNNPVPTAPTLPAQYPPPLQHSLSLPLPQPPTTIPVTTIVEPLPSPSPSPSSLLVPKTTNGDNPTATVSASSSRWPKAEVQALINLRTSLDQKYHDGVPKGPLWEEISAAMAKLGYNRNAKRCKEKWENINKYFKKVKESNKKRPEDSKTCPYFHQLDAIYREKNKAPISPSAAPSAGGAPILVRPEQQWPMVMSQEQQRTGMAMDEPQGTDEGGEEEDEDEEGASGYEIVANNSSSGVPMGGPPTTTTGSTTALDQ